MKLKSVEILGFKSFANHARLEIPLGLTAVVGPNGCGKTNVTEAVRWVLGEQNVRTLRGGEKMEEVIFNGSVQRKPLGMAEVRLAFDDPERRMGQEAVEVVIGRQIFRSGESAYSVNGKLCRLKDIQDLFMDTGMGSNAYSMIENKMVEAVLSDRAEERRFLFEEAAGIQKYKQRRKFALRKLEATEVDLQRIEDIVGEAQRQVGSLGRQVGKARRFRKLQDQLRRVGVTLARAELERLAAEEAPQAQRLAAVRDELSGVIAADDSRSAQAEQLRARIEEARRGAGELFSRLESLGMLVRRGEEELTVIREQRRAGKEWIAGSGERLAALSQSLEGRRSDLEARRDQLEELRGELRSSERAHFESRERSNARNLTLETARKSSAGAQSHREQLVARVYSSTSRAERLAESAVELRRRAAELEGQAESFGGELEELRDRLSEAAERAAILEEQRLQAVAGLEERNGLLERSRQESAELREQHSRLRLEREGLEQERQLLERLQREMEGFGEGVKRLFRERREGLEAVAAELFTTEKRYEQAVEAALGARLQSVIARDRGALLSAVEFLRGAGAGRASLIARELAEGRGAIADRPDLPVLAWCDQVVRCAPEYEFLKNLLLSEVGIVENLEEALALQAGSRRPLHLVTLTGETLEHCTVTGGSARGGQSGAMLLQRRRRLEELAAEDARIAVRAGELEGQLADRAGQTAALEEELAGSRGSLRELEQECAQARNGHTRLTLECENLLARGREAGDQAAEAAARVGELEAQRDEALTAAAEAREELEKLEQELAAGTTRLDELQEQARSAAQALQELSLELAERRTRLAELEKSLALVARELEAASQQAGQLEQEIAGRKARLEELDAREEQVREQLKVALEERQSLGELRDSHEEELAGLRRELEALEAALRETHRRREALTEERHALELALEKLRGRRELVLRQIRDGWQLDLERLPEDFAFWPDQEEREAGEPEASLTLQADLQEKLAALGPVNELAIEEYEREKERLDFLKKQRDDLVEARESLLRLVEQINKTARERFQDTFTRVQENFQAIFGSLFEGGQAHVSLAEPDNPLESPIEVEVRPRGKKMLGLGLLSGGEKALTALSLLFAIYSVKPSPFCILDEVDAPLDDANIDRFLSIIRRFSANTQFIMVTHNKHTMEAADCLYGVTMQEPGVSKVVSVRLDQVGESGRIRYNHIEEEEAKVG